MSRAPRQRELILVFGSVRGVMRAEKAARDRALDVDVIPAPRSVSSECGTVLEARRADVAALRALGEELALAPSRSYLREGTGYRLVSLEALALESEGLDGESVALTAKSAYGGCGAKLSKGLLDAILCGLPRLESPELVVGIESADDAGVVRVTPELGIIHTADFFPPMVDDPYTFGRIAAANALSDVYAMGGEPIAGINLVSFPTKDYPKSTLREVLRGGLDALAEAGAVLAGGHTIDGAELLYGLALTGRVHPERVWRNGGARRGDALLLTKPLGTGLVTTAAKAELAEPEHLATAIRTMAALNREAAEAAQEAAPSAVTDVTGFSLAGHAAEMALASGLALELRLDALPALPGALAAARMGLVPAGAAKNRESLREVLSIAEDADPYRVDLALDPQTSGGLLVACSEEAARLMLARVPGASIVGRALEGLAGSVRLI